MAEGMQIVKSMSYSKKRKSIGEVAKREQQAKKITRTTVVNPKHIDWPDNIDESSLTELKNKLKELVGALKFPCHKVPLNEIRKVDKSNRKEFREQWRAKQATDTGFNVQNYVHLRSSLSIGVNCVSRGLDLNELAGVIIEKDVSPSIITKLLVPIALTKEIPIIAIDGLKEVFQSTARIRCIALGFKECCNKISNHFHPLLNLVKLHGKQYLDEPGVDEIPIPTAENVSAGDITPKTKKEIKRKFSKSSFKSPKVRKTEITIKPKITKKSKSS